MRFKFDFSVDAWIQGVEVDAANQAEAEEKLGQMTLAELIEEGYVKDFSILKDGFDVEVTERTVVARCTNIMYDPEEVSELNLHIEDLPTEVTVEADVDEAIPEEDAISDELDSKLYNGYHIFPVKFEYEVVEEK